MRSGFKEAADPEFGVALQAEQVDLDNMYEGVEQGTLGQSLIESDHVEVGDRIHMSDFGRVESECAYSLEKLGNADSCPLKLYNSDSFQQGWSKVLAHPTPKRAANGSGHRQVIIALLLKISGEPFDCLRDLFGRGLNRRVREGRDFIFDSRVKLMQRTGGLGRFPQDVAASETGEIVGGILQAKAMHGATRAEQFQPSVLEVSVHLQDRGAVLGF